MWSPRQPGRAPWPAKAIERPASAGGSATTVSEFFHDERIVARRKDMTMKTLFLATAALAALVIGAPIGAHVEYVHGWVNGQYFHGNGKAMAVTGSALASPKDLPPCRTPVAVVVAAGFGQLSAGGDYRAGWPTAVVRDPGVFAWRRRQSV